MWSEENLKNLKGSPLLKDIRNLKTGLQLDYRLAAQNVPGFEREYSQKEFFEMWLAAESRHLKNLDHGAYGVPLADIFNHDVDKGVTMKYQGRDTGKEPGVYIRAIKNIRKGEQIFWHYTDKGNYEFLKLYGFVLTDGTQPKSYKFFVDMKKPELSESQELLAVWKGKSRLKFDVDEEIDSE